MPEATEHIGSFLCRIGSLGDMHPCCLPGQPCFILQYRRSQDVWYLAYSDALEARLMLLSRTRKEDIGIAMGKASSGQPINLVGRVG